MRATSDVLAVWRKFDEFPMETLTKAWYFYTASDRKQRTVEQMKEHREQYGTSGNCFDLALWLLYELRREKLEGYAILTPDRHVAVIAVNDRGNRYLCDLGDQWIEPILIEREREDFAAEFLDGFFPGAQVRLDVQPNRLIVTYRRPNGKEANQTYLLTPVPDDQLIAAGENTQRTLRKPLVEKRMFTDREVIHWEFDNYESFFSSMAGKTRESKLKTMEEWVERIAAASGIHKRVVREALEVYAKFTGPRSK